MDDKKIKLNLGMGNDYKDGYTNIDINPEFCKNGIDLVADMRNLPYEANSVDEIVAEGCLEHLSYRDHLPTLLHWFTILKPGGWIYIETPNLTAVINEVQNQSAYIFTHAYETLYGGQRNKTEFHTGLHTELGLTILMILAGFMEITVEPHTKNTDKEKWNIRLKATKLYPWSFPGWGK